jgi:hypothetical protein
MSEESGCEWRGPCRDKGASERARADFHAGPGSSVATRELDSSAK